MNCKPIFSFSIDMKLSDKGVVVGKYDAVNPSLTAITQSNKVSRIRNFLLKQFYFENSCP